MKITYELRTDTDCEIDVYDEECPTLERWFVTADDIAHFRSLLREEFGDPNVGFTNYF